MFRGSRKGRCLAATVFIVLLALPAAAQAKAKTVTAKVTISNGGGSLATWSLTFSAKVKSASGMKISGKTITPKKASPIAAGATRSLSVKLKGAKAPKSVTLSGRKCTVGKLKSKKVPVTCTILGVQTPAPATPAGGGIQTYYRFAPYINYSLNTPTELVPMRNASGTNSVVLGFVNGKTNSAGGGACDPVWRSDLAGFDASGGSARVTPDLTAFRAGGGTATVSFGGAGANDKEIAVACTSENSLKSEIQAVINTYGATAIDFDVEGSIITNSAANSRRDSVAKQLQAANPGLKVSYTVAVGLSGLAPDDLTLVTNAVAAGVNVDYVNLMTMDYGDESGIDMGTAAITAATEAHNDLKPIFGGTDAQVWQRIGITPMIGRNDTQNEVFGLDDAQQLVAFAMTVNPKSLAMWSVHRDHQCGDAPINSPWTAKYYCSDVAQNDWDFARRLQSPLIVP